MSQASSIINWPNLLVNCIVGACTGLLVGLFLPIGQIAEKIFGGSELGPGQTGTLGAVAGLASGVLFFFSRSDTPGYKEPSPVVYVQDDFVNSHVPQIINSILIVTIIVQVVLVKIWT